MIEHQIEILPCLDIYKNLIYFGFPYTVNTFLKTYITCFIDPHMCFRALKMCKPEVLELLLRK